MATQLSDTSAEAERVQIEILRSMPSWWKFQLWNDLNMSMRQVALAGVGERFPSASPQELRRTLATILLGQDLATQAYGPEPDPPTIGGRKRVERGPAP
ncbi:MAG: hypothetical protein WAO35_00590 [Terriglobia bacterium]